MPIAVGRVSTSNIFSIALSAEVVILKKISISIDAYAGSTRPIHFQAIVSENRIGELTICHYYSLIGVSLRYKNTLNLPKYSSFDNSLCYYHQGTVVHSSILQ